MMENLLDSSSVTTCKNSGFNLMDKSVSSLAFTSDNYPSDYGEKTNCYWSIYAPGAMKIKVTITEFVVCKSKFRYQNYKSIYLSTY